MINITYKFPIAGIYKIVSPSNKVYIGQSINIYQRWANYHSLNRKATGLKLLNSFQKYNCKNHLFTLIEECPIEQLNERETYWKQVELDKVNNDWSKVLFCELYDNGTGPRSKQIKEKISKSSIGKKFSETSKKKMSEAKKGIPLSEDHKQKIIKTRLSEEWKQQIRKPITQYDINGNFIKEWNSIKEAGESLNINQSNIGSVCSGRFKTAGKFIWNFK
jgi:group I intron endonuclease